GGRGLAALNHGAGATCAGIARGLRGEVIGLRVHDQSAPDYARRPRRNRDDVQVGGHARIAAAVRLEARQVARMALGRAGVRMRLAVGIEVALGAHAVAGAAVAGFMDVKAELAVGPEAGDVRGDVYMVATLHEADVAAHGAALGGLENRAGPGRVGMHALAGPEQR